jgi:RNA polymerase sigma-70 factor (ECF subfamily)
MAILPGDASLARSASVKPHPALTWGEVSTQEWALARRCVVGDEEACTELVETHERMVYQLAFNLLGDHHEALDLSQDVFLQVFRTLGAFRGNSALRTWIYRIVVNQARNRQRWWRRRRRDAQVSLDDHLREHGDVPARANTLAPDRMYARKEIAERLHEALTLLPFDQRTAIVLREVDGLSYEDIAYSLGVAVGTIKSRLARARLTLRKELRDL